MDGGLALGIGVVEAGAPAVVRGERRLWDGSDAHGVDADGRDQPRRELDVAEAAARAALARRRRARGAPVRDRARALVALVNAVAARKRVDRHVSRPDVDAFVDQSVA